MDNKKHKINDSFTIPYGQQAENRKIIAIKDSFAEQLFINVPKEEYKLKVGYIYGGESFLVGNKAKVILHPRLSLQSN